MLKVKPCLSAADLGSSGNDCRCKRSPHQQCSPLGTHHLRWSGPIWSHLVHQNHEESSLRPGLGIPRNARDILASPEPLRWLPAAHLPDVTFKHGSKWFQYVPMWSRKLPANQTGRISHLHQYGIYGFPMAIFDGGLAWLSPS